MTQAIALFSGGLDSMLAVLLMRKQQVDVLGLTFVTPFFNASKAKAAVRQIPIPLIIEDITEEHLQMLKSPRYGYGKNMNPCIDCHTLMLKLAGRKMEEMGADVIITGEVLGQRPMSQTRQSLYVVAKNSGYADDILRPLSAQLLPPVRVEREGRIDRSQLLGLSGRGRKDQMRLANEFGLTAYPPAAGGCLLTDPIFSKRLRDLMVRGEDRHLRDYDLLKYGRHFRAEGGAKIIVGRNRADNEALGRLTEDDDLVCNMATYPGPYVLVPYGDEAAQTFAAQLCVRYSDAPDEGEADVVCRHRGNTITLCTRAASREACEAAMMPV